MRVRRSTASDWEQHVALSTRVRMSASTVYGMSSSGNCYKVRLLLEQLRVTLRMDRNRYAQRLHALEPSFWPGIPTAACRCSNWPGRNTWPSPDAILFYLAEGTAFWPQDRLATRRSAAVDVLRAVQPRALYRRGEIHLRLPAAAGRAPRRIAATCSERGNEALRGDGATPGAGARFLVAERYSIADIALYAYTHAAGDGGFDLQRYPAVSTWLARVEAQPRFVRMPGVS